MTSTVPTGPSGSTALILAGAVAKGAFGAGVIHELARRGERIHRIVATSSGALNGVMLAAGIRAGETMEAANRLVALWRDKGDWQHVFHPNIRGLMGGQGLSDGTEITELLRANVRPAPPGGPRHAVDLAVVVASAWGAVGHIGNQPATTFEHVLSYPGPCFDTAEGLEEVFHGALASCAFPGVFVPVDLSTVGPCFDGGAVDNAPVAVALAETPGNGMAPVDRVLVVAPSPQVMRDKPSLHGTGLVGHLAEILIGERLYRDLSLAEETNEQLRRLAALRDRGVLTPEAHREVLHALSPASPLRPIEIIQVRPVEQLPGDAFEGFLYRYLRERYVDEGKDAARRALDGHPVR